MLTSIIMFLAVLQIAFSTTVNKTIGTVANYTSLFMTSNITTLNDNNFDLIVRRGRVSPYLILFTVRKCGSCNHIIEIFENVTKILNESGSPIETAKIDCFAYSWSAMRFSINHIPQVAFVVNDTVRYLNKNITIENIMEFIDDENDTNERKPFPAPMNYLGVAKKVFNSLDEVMTNYMKGKGLYWHSGFSAIFIIGFIALLAFIEWKFVNCCCKGKKKESKFHHVHGAKCNHSHGTKPKTTTKEKKE